MGRFLEKLLDAGKGILTLIVMIVCFFGAIWLFMLIVGGLNDSTPAGEYAPEPGVQSR